MTLRTAIAKITALALSVSLLQSPYVLAGQQDNAKQERLETCRKILESLEDAKRLRSFTEQLQQSADTRRIVDLTRAGLTDFKAATAKANVDDVLVMNERRLSDQDFVSALGNSPALFSVAATSDARAVGAILGVKAGQPEIVVAIPTNSVGVQNVFGVPATISAPTVEYLAATSRQFLVLRNSRLLNHSLNGRSLAEQLLSRARRHTSDTLVVVAHNERGLLKLPDGSSVRVDVLYKALGSRVGLILSCDTIHAEEVPKNALLTNRELDFKDVAAGLASAEHLLSTNPNASLGSMLFAFSSGIPVGDSSSKEKVMMIAMVVGGLIVVGLLFYWVCEDPANAAPFCPQGPKSKTAFK